MDQDFDLHIEYKKYFNKFWVKLCRKNGDLVSTEDKINKFNKRNIEHGYIFDIFNQEGIATRKEIEKLIDSVSIVPKQTMYKDGVKVDGVYYDRLVYNMNLDSLTAANELYYGITVRRSSIRTFPTVDRVYKNPSDNFLDRFMESAIYPCEPCIIYCASRDGQWYFIRCRFYYGWVKAEDIALGSKEEIEDYCDSKDFIVVTGKRIYIGYNPVSSDTNGMSYEMGVKIPIIKAWDKDILVGSMYVEGHYIATLPTRNDDGSLKFVNALIPYNEDVSLGYLKCTRTNIINQGFKLQGERYGWGGDFEARDCSSFVMDIFRCFGMLLPRNSSDQLNNCTGRTIIFNSDAERNVKLRMLSKAKAGELIYLNGHVVLFIGEDNGHYYILHDTIGVYVKEEKTGIKKYLPINGVTVSDIGEIYTSAGAPYIDAIIGLKNLFQ